MYKVCYGNYFVSTKWEYIENPGVEIRDRA